MNILRDTSIRKKLLIAPIIMIATLGIILFVAVAGLENQRKVLTEVREILLKRLPLVHEFITASELVQSDVYRLSVLKFMQAPEIEILAVSESLNMGLNNLKIINGEFLSKWTMDQNEKTLLQALERPLNSFRHQVRQAVMAVSENPSFGILLVKSAALPFNALSELLSKFLDYQKEKIVKAKQRSKETVNRIRTTIIVISILMALIAIFVTTLVGSKYISKPIASVTQLMWRLTEGDLSLKVNNTERKDEIGQMEKALSVFRKNAIDKVDADRKLRESEIRFRHLYNNAMVGLYRARFSDGVLLEINQHFAELAGYKTVAECMEDFVAPEHYADPKVREQMLEQIMQNGAVKHFEAEFIRKNDTPIWVSFSARLYPEDGYIEGTLVDITDRKQLESQLRQAQKMEAIGSLAGGVAHEFNNILGAIIGNTELAIADVPESNPARDCLKEIQAASLRAKDVVRQILGFARKSVFQLRPVQIGPIISETLKLMRASIPATIEIRRNLSCKSDTVMADPTQIKQVLINLCSNAKNAMQAQGGVLEVKLEDASLDEKSAGRYEDLRPGNYVKLTVRDTGHGIDLKIIDRIFDPYFSTTSLAVGTGMGLAVVYGIVKHHNGAISVENEPGKGAVFEVLFPLIEAEAEQKTGEPQA